MADGVKAISPVPIQFFAQAAVSAQGACHEGALKVFREETFRAYILKISALSTLCSKQEGTPCQYFRQMGAILGGGI